MKTVYVCEKCGEQFRDWQECSAHEDDAHVTPIAYTGVLPRGYTDASKYPPILLVDMTDGARAIYIFQAIDKPAEPAESEDDESLLYTEEPELGTA